jgi:hypothetical protein
MPFLGLLDKKATVFLVALGVFLPKTCIFSRKGAKIAKKFKILPD